MRHQVSFMKSEHSLQSVKKTKVQNLWHWTFVLEPFLF